jgi:hypothetical protein
MPRTLEEWKDAYYEQQALHTEARGMLGAERDRALADVAIKEAKAEAYAREMERYAAENAALREDAATVLRGFDEGVFIRSTNGDGEGDWAIKLFPFLKAMGRLQTACTARDTSTPGPALKPFDQTHDAAGVPGCGELGTNSVQREGKES